MTAVPLAPAVPFGDDGRIWRRALLRCALCALLVILLFWRDARDVVTIWATVSTYHHCALVVLLSGWSVWQRRQEVAVIPPDIWLTGLWLTALGALVWRLGDAGHIALFRHAGLVLMLQSLVPLLLGRAVAQALIFPTAYLGFAVPFGDEFLPLLQMGTARMALALLQGADVPAVMNGIFIATPNGYYKVAEACAGVKFLLAMLAYGALVANVCFRTWHRRTAFLLLCAITPVLANGVRAFATIYVGYLSSPEVAGSFDHIVYGWIFFAAVMALVMGLAAPFFERRPGDPWLAPATPPPATRPKGAMVAILALMSLLAGVILWSHLGRMAGRADLSAPIAAPQIPGWAQVAKAGRRTWRPHYAGADQIWLGHYQDHRGRSVDLAIVLYGAQDDGQEMIGYSQGAAGGGDDPWVWSADGPAWPDARTDWVSASGAVRRLVVTFYVLNGAATGSAADVTWAQLRARLLGRDQAMAAILLSAEDGDHAAALTAIRDFQRAFGSPARLATQALARARR